MPKRRIHKWHQWWHNDKWDHQRADNYKKNQWCHYWEILMWMKRVQGQRAQKKATQAGLQENKDKEFNTIKCTKLNSSSEQVTRPKESANTVVQCMTWWDGQLLEGDLQSVKDRTTFRWCAETSPGECNKRNLRKMESSPRNTVGQMENLYSKDPNFQFPWHTITPNYQPKSQNMSKNGIMWI